MTEIEHFIELCKNHDLKEAKEYFFANEKVINDEFDDNKQDYEIMHKYLVEFANNNQYEFIDFLFELKLANKYQCFDNCCENGDLELSKYISQMPNFDIWRNIKDIFISCQLDTAKNLLKIIPDIDICKDDDIILRSVCIYDINRLIHNIPVEYRVEFLKWILEEVKPDYDIVAVKTIRDGIIHKNAHYPIIKYLNHYIAKRET